MTDLSTSAWGWRPGPTLLFMALLGLLLSVGLVVALSPRERPIGLPDDPDTRAARELVHENLPIPPRGLVLETAIAGESPVAELDSLKQQRLAAAHGRLRRAARLHPRDVRVSLALAHLELAAGRYQRAAREYRAIVARSPHYGEARLGLGVALALQAGAPMDELHARQQLMQALGQFANVTPDDPAYAAASFDRVRLLAQVGREREAREVLARALAVAPTPRWTARYRALGDEF
ncbi:MAG: tetratricopeptide repeat protein [Candidatus Eisenbacteria bacterium]|uniref:Tetratricopeptide repeat protein n=1 Tax=Eiseniibacteriota bacterium TaxID=2212470 RepID=A0A849T1Z3_UNCEI|nr:tetratricopeptide repeat protein [Candidatus Eisenbacteria bacterium]